MDVCTACTGRADVIFAIDASDSIRTERFPHVIRLLSSVVEQMDIGSERVRVGAVKFANNASVEFQLNAYRSKHDVMEAIERVSFVGGRTNISGALWTLVLNSLSSLSPSISYHTSVFHYRLKPICSTNPLINSLLVPSKLTPRNLDLRCDLVFVCF